METNSIIFYIVIAVIVIIIGYFIWSYMNKKSEIVPVTNIEVKDDIITWDHPDINDSSIYFIIRNYKERNDKKPLTLIVKEHNMKMIPEMKSGRTYIIATDGSIESKRVEIPIQTGVEKVIKLTQPNAINQ